MKENAYKRWIQVGYDLFSEEGHEGIQIERLSRMTGLNKSGFYHYFGDRYVYIDHLIQHHLENATHFANQTRELNDFNPSFIRLLLDYRKMVFFETQLNNNRNFDLFRKAHEAVSESVAEAVLPIWSEYLQLPPEIASGLWEYMRDSFNSRITFKNYSFAFVLGLTDQFRNTVTLTTELVYRK